MQIFYLVPRVTIAAFSLLSPRVLLSLFISCHNCISDIYWPLLTHAYVGEGFYMSVPTYAVPTYADIGTDAIFCLEKLTVVCFILHVPEIKFIFE